LGTFTIILTCLICTHTPTDGQTDIVTDATDHSTIAWLLPAWMTKCKQHPEGTAVSTE